MTIRIEKGRDIFELNNGLDKLFPKLDSSEMEYVVFVADDDSVFRKRSEVDRRLLSLKLCDGLWVNGRPTVKGQKILDKKNTDVEQAIVKFNQELNNNKSVKIQKTLETLNDYYDSLLDFMKKLDDTGEFDEQVKIYANNAKSIKDGIIKETFEQILYFEKQLSFEYEVPEDVLDDLKENKEIDSNTADSIDVDKL